MSHRADHASGPRLPRAGRVRAASASASSSGSGSTSARADEAPEPGDFVSIDVAGESLLVVRGKDGELRGFYNVCRHRGSRLCDPETHGHAKGAIKCPYHAWSYSYDGSLIGTPLVGKDELDRSQLRALAGAPRRVAGLRLRQPGRRAAVDPARVARTSDRRAAPVRALAHGRAAHGAADGQSRSRRTGRSWSRTTTSASTARPCTPSSSAVAPTFGKGLVVEEGRNDWGVSIVGGGVGYTATGTTTLPVMPGRRRRGGERDVRRDVSSRTCSSTSPARS